MSDEKKTDDAVEGVVPVFQQQLNTSTSDEKRSSKKGGPPSSADIEGAVPIEHMLSSVAPGGSEVEQIAERIERRREERIPVTFKSRVRFLKGCRKIARRQGYDTARISEDDLKEYRDRVAAEADEFRGICNIRILKRIGVYADVDCLLQILDRAVNVMKDSDIDDSWFFYTDFSAYHTQVVSRWPWMRTSLRQAMLVLFAFYFFTPILFCNVMDQSNICTDNGSRYSGLVSALYFASTTLSTVGYGDLTVSQDPRWKSFIGSLYMLIAMVVAVVSFSAAADTASTPIQRTVDRLFERFDANRVDSEEFLYKKIRRIKFIRLTEIFVLVFAFILIGVIASQVAVAFEEDPEAQWTWMTSFYWAVQTTTTIGYGDLAQPFGLRWFKIFYLTFATYVVGSSLGRLGSLKTELSEARRQHAWDRRKVTRRFVDEMQAYDCDDKVDQYEFLTASLISLGKVDSDDIRPIMDKFRTLAGNKGYISVTEDICEEKIDEDSTYDELEEDEIDHEE